MFICYKQFPESAAKYCILGLWLAIPGARETVRTGNLLVSVDDLDSVY